MEFDTARIEFQPLVAGTARRAPCVDCGTLSPWHPEQWMFRYIPVRGQGRHGAKVRTERLCPVCVEKRQTSNEPVRV